MNLFHQIRSGFFFIRRYQFRWVLIIAVTWTLIDLGWLYYFHLIIGAANQNTLLYISPEAILARAAIVFTMSSLMGYILIFGLRQVFRDLPLLYSLVIKTGILLVASFVMNFLLHLSYSVYVLKISFTDGMHKFFIDAISGIWLVHHSIGWIFLFIATQLAIEFYEKYSPGVFWSILIGRYISPKSEKRIVMFLDLTDSTPIAEKLDNRKYFSFIRDFIYYTSIAMLEHHGRIYQYVGDEIVVSWPCTDQHRLNCIKALKLAIRLLERRNNYFRRRYGYTPRFTVGIHAGEVMVGEIGIIKKDLAMSGDIMNTAARICAICNDLDRSYLASKEFIGDINPGVKIEVMGPVDLKGKSESMELFAINI